MLNAAQTLERQFLEMRARCLALAADLDRLQRSTGGETLFQNDPRLQQFQEAFTILKNLQPDRAERIQLLFSDKTTETR